MRLGRRVDDSSLGRQTVFHSESAIKIRDTRYEIRDTRYEDDMAPKK
ncbi:hypothetical protein VCR6J2_360199 [Vibrio coralliirubri]|nr:hypothetical protein VCR6J2_360199 [Vibrio coralliirubri]